MDFSGSRYKKELHLEFIFISQLFQIVRWPISRVQPNLQSSGPLWCLLHSNFAHFAICTLKKVKSSSRCDKSAPVEVSLNGPKNHALEQAQAVQLLYG